MTIKAVEVYEVHCDAHGNPGCMYSGAYDSESRAVALTRAREEGWRVYGNQVEGYRFKCPECVAAKAKLECRS